MQTRTSKRKQLPWEILFSRSELTDRQKVFILVKTKWPWPCSAKAARIAGYSESVCRKAERIIVRGSRVVSLILATFDKDSERSWKAEGRFLGDRSKSNGTGKGTGLVIEARNRTSRFWCGSDQISRSIRYLDRFTQPGRPAP